MMKLAYVVMEQLKGVFEFPRLFTAVETDFPHGPPSAAIQAILCNGKMMLMVSFLFVYNAFPSLSPRKF